MAEEFALADQLKSEFRGRGADVSGMRASSTPELMRRAEMGRDPRVNVAEEAFRENYRAHRNAARTAPSRPPQNQAQSRQGTAASGAGYAQSGASSGNGNQAASRPGYRNRPAPHDTLSEEIAGRGRARQQRADNRNSGGSQTPESDPAGSRPQNGKNNARERNPGGGSKNTGAKNRGAKTQGSRSNGSGIRVERTRAAKKKAAAAGDRTEEYELRHTKLPVAIIVLTLVGVLIIFTLVESLAEVYQTSTDIARMKETRDSLKETAAALELKLDEKNDVRTIREIAVGELGMADEDSMQRRFISVSGGERIELLETEDDSPQAGGVLFSSLGEYINRFLGRFR